MGHQGAGALKGTGYQVPGTGRYLVPVGTGYRSVPGTGQYRVSVGQAQVGRVPGWAGGATFAATNINSGLNV